MTHQVPRPSIPSTEIGHARPHAATVAFGGIGLTAAALQIANGVEVEVVAIVLVAASLCYLAAAALERRWVAWATIIGATVVVFVSEALGLPWWTGTASAGAVLVAVAALRRARTTAVTTQTLALAAYGGAATLSVQLSPTAGLLLVGAALAAHAVWDVAHWRRDAVVPRSLAEFCVFLDVPLGVAAVIVALTP
ncbi:hypothetical protein [Nocardioides dongkuii]|uniref:hypothetical protein n=1 Tax=Nocardioides dongkuii TaxID=2760089 RepID=UPI0015FE251E|nr:hypothetical protein [Nocardioides dongkuii]